MEPSSPAATMPAAQEIVANIDQKAIRLSALLRDIDNHPVPLDPEAGKRLDGILEMLECRIAATRAILHQSESALV